MKDEILGAAIEVVALHGLNNWTVEEVANRAHCAKGLVNYHYRSKNDLLARAAETIRDDRCARRLASVQRRGTTALDRLWQTLVKEVESGWFAAWLSLLSADDPLRRKAASQPEEGRRFAANLGRALSLGEELTDRAELIQGGLDGLQVLLLSGVATGKVEEAYHQFWLTIVD